MNKQQFDYHYAADETVNLSTYTYTEYKTPDSQHVIYISSIRIQNKESGEWHQKLAVSTFTADKYLEVFKHPRLPVQVLPRELNILTNPNTPAQACLYRILFSNDERNVNVTLLIPAEENTAEVPEPWLSGFDINLIP